jgi:hypothetical protein
VGLGVLIIGAALGAAGKKQPTNTVAATATTESTSTTSSTEPPTTVAPTSTLPPTTLPPTTLPPTVPPTPAPTAPPRPTNINTDKGYVMTSFQLKQPDVNGDFAATARIRNDNSGRETAVWRVSLFRGEQLLGSVEGSANGVAPGQTVTVDMVSQDKATSGVNRYEMQTEANYPS